MVTRRRFLRRTGAIAPVIVAGGGFPSKANSAQRSVAVTGKPNPDLRAFDRMMANFVGAHNVPGASLAITRRGRLIYARGFGHADVERKTPVAPDALFRIASISKPFTAVATLLLVERGKLRLDEPALRYLPQRPHLEPGESMDPRWKNITIRQLLQHTGGWDRERSFDPIGRPTEIAADLDIPLPVRPEHIIRYMMGRKLDFDPGVRHAYSNFGYILLGRVIESITRRNYDLRVRQSVLAPLGITGMTLGRARVEHRVPREVTYYDPKKRSGKAVASPPFGDTVPVPYGAFNFEAYDSHGGWIASAVDLVRFASAFDDPAASPLLKEPAIQSMWRRPEGAAGIDAAGKPRAAYYGCGWQVRPKGPFPRVNAWHTGRITGTSALLVRRWGGLDWAVLFNTDTNPAGRDLASLIDPLLHQAAAEVRAWPEDDLFGVFLKA